MTKDLFQEQSSSRRVHVPVMDCRWDLPAKKAVSNQKIPSAGLASLMPAPWLGDDPPVGSKPIRAIEREPAFVTEHHLPPPVFISQSRLPNQLYTNFCAGAFKTGAAEALS